MPDHFRRYCDVVPSVLADWFKVDQNKMQKRLMLCVPLLANGAFVGHLIMQLYGRYFQLDKPDTGYDCSVDSKYVSVPRRRITGSQQYRQHYECSFHDLFLLCRRVSGTFYEGCLSGRNYRSSIPESYPCDKETDESIVVRQCNLNT